MELNPAPLISSTSITLPRHVSFQPWELFAIIQLQILLDPCTSKSISCSHPDPQESKEQIPSLSQ